jgi:hypothetical protein
MISRYQRDCGMVRYRRRSEAATRTRARPPSWTTAIGQYGSRSVVRRRGPSSRRAVTRPRRRRVARLVGVREVDRRPGCRRMQWPAVPMVPRDRGCARSPKRMVGDLELIDESTGSATCSWRRRSVAAAPVREQPSRPQKRRPAQLRDRCRRACGPWQSSDAELGTGVIACWTRSAARNAFGGRCTDRPSSTRTTLGPAASW